MGLYRDDIGVCVGVRWYNDRAISDLESLGLVVGVSGKRQDRWE